MRNLDRCGRIRMLGENVYTLIDESFSSIRFLARIKPGIDPDDLDLEVWIDRLCAEHECIDALYDFRHRDRRDVACNALGRQLGSNLALYIASFIEARIVCRHVVCSLVAGCVLKLHIRELGRHFECRVHVTERGCEDQLIACTRQTLNRAFSIRAFGHVFEESRLDLVTESFDHLLTGNVVLVCPAEITWRPDIDEADLQLVFCMCRPTKHKAGRGGDCQQRLFHVPCAPFSPSKYNSTPWEPDCRSKLLPVWHERLAERCRRVHHRQTPVA